MTETGFARGELFQRIRRAADQLGKGGRSVAELVLSRPEEVALLPAAKVAEQLGVSESTVVRFASSIGVDGYPALRLALQQQLRQHLNPAQRLDQYASQYDKERTALESFQADLADVAATERDLNRAHLSQAVKLISTSREVYILGLRGSFGLAYTLYHQLAQTLPSVRLMDPGRGDPVDFLAHLGSKDTLLGISFPRYTRATVHAMQLAASRGLRLIAITDSPLSPIAKPASVVLTGRCTKRAFANSNVGPLALINALVSEVAVRNRRKSVKLLARLDEALRTAGVLYSPDSSAAKRGNGSPEG